MACKVPKQRKTLTKLKATFLVICLGLEGCQSIPTPPPVEQLGYSVKYKKFRGCRTDTNVCRNISRDDASLEGAQALAPADFKSMNAWIDELINMLQARKIQSVEVIE